MVGGAVVVAVVGFLLFRPDTLFTEVRSDESLTEAFPVTTTGDASGGGSTTSHVDHNCRPDYLGRRAFCG
jgi:hypothetical protein